MALNTWARPEAVTNLIQFQIDREREVICLNPNDCRQTKKYRPLIRLPKTLDPWLDEWTTDFLISTRNEKHDRKVKSVRSAFETNRVRVELLKLIRYSLRHFMATEVAGCGAPLEQREIWMGHKRVSITHTYTHFEPNHLAEAKQATEAVMTKLKEYTNRELLHPKDSFWNLEEQNRGVIFCLYIKRMEWWARAGLNCRPLRCQRSALPLSYAPSTGGLEGPRYSLLMGACLANSWRIMRQADDPPHQPNRASETVSRES